MVRERGKGIADMWLAVHINWTKGRKKGAKCVNSQMYSERQERFKESVPPNLNTHNINIPICYCKFN